MHEATATHLWWGRKPHELSMLVPNYRGDITSPQGTPRIPRNCTFGEIAQMTTDVRVGRLLSLAFPQRERANVFTLQDPGDRTNEPEENNNYTTTNNTLPEGPEFRADVGRGKFKAVSCPQ